jgi:hypothetical protein
VLTRLTGSGELPRRQTPRSGRDTRALLLVGGGRPAGERSATVLAHEVTRAKRMADVFEGRVTDPLMQSAPTMAHLSLAVALDVAAKRGFGDLTTGRPPSRSLDARHVRAGFNAKHGAAVMRRVSFESVGQEQSGYPSMSAPAA